MKNILDLIKEKRLYFDGGTGTYLQQNGLKSGEKPEIWNIEKPEVIEALHRAYFNAGANIVKTNTFGVNKDKFKNHDELIRAGVRCAVKAKDGKEDRFVAFDMGPTGRMLKPFGDMDFEHCVSLYSENVKVAAKCGIDLILIETMNDALETKAAVIAAKENCDLPIFVTNAYDLSGKLMTGAAPKAMIAMLEGLGVSALGMNCSFGPDKMVDIIAEFEKYSSLPIIVNPNAGLPAIIDGKTEYSLSPDDFADTMISLCKSGAHILGGCCGTTPEYIEKMILKTADIPYTLPKEKGVTLVSSYTHAVEIGSKPLLIGERINPTGKKKLKEAIKSGDMEYILSEGVRQAEKGVDILDVNVGVPGIDEGMVMQKTIESLQAVTDKPLQIDSSDKTALEKAMRIYAGKPMINSVNGKKESMDSVLPLVKKYGGVLVALTLDEDGIPDTAEKRAEIAYSIIDEASKYGINKKDIVVDPLALSVSSDSNSANITLKTIEILTQKGINTSLGVSNISFGLPNRDVVNSAFFTQALTKGLKCAIMNPFSEFMLNSYYAFNALSGIDTACSDYIAYASDIKKEDAKDNTEVSLKDAVIKGLKDAAISACQQELSLNAPMDIINNMIIPALNEIGEEFEKGRAYLPQLLMSAESAAAAFEIVKENISKTDISDDKKVIIATVKGDIHDIGKNIVKVVLQSYGFTVIDLGKDVEPAVIAEEAIKTGANLVGLSALMTTTVNAMEETIKLLREKAPDVKVVVGGAVLTEEYAKEIDAHYYAKDAMDAVGIVKKVYNE
jgi:5-methyltetrahydrofolate--homocysteine methyltransferase